MTKAPSKTKSPTKAPKLPPIPKPKEPEARKPAGSLDDVMDAIERQKRIGTADPGAVTSEQRKAAATVIPDAGTKQKMLKELADHFGTSPEEIEQQLKINDPAMELVQQGGEAPKAGPVKQHRGTRAPVKITHDYWLKDNVVDQWPLKPIIAGDGTIVPNTGNNRVAAGTVINLPAEDARLLIEAGKATRADPLPGEF